MDALLHDLRSAVRSLVRRPAFLAVAALTLAVGIGANTALFSVVDAVLLRPLPYPASSELVSVFETQAGRGTLDAPSPGNVLDWRRESRTLTGVAAWWVESTTVLGDGGSATEEIPSARVTADFFPVLGVAPALGRTFTADEVAREDLVAVLTYELWQRRFAGDAGVIGRDVAFKTGTWRVIGVMPAGFRTPGTQRGEVQLFKPWDFQKGYAHLPEMPRDHRFLRAAARLAPGVRLAAAQAELDVIASAIAEAHPKTNAGWGVTLVPMRDALVGDSKPALLVLLGAVGCVLLLACANVTSLLLVRATGRGREMAVRTVLGASRARLARQLLMEALLVAGLGGVLGLVIAVAGVAFLVDIRPGTVLFVDDAAIDGRVALFAIAVSVVAGLVAGLAPAYRASGLSPSEALKGAATAVSADHGRQRLKTLIVVSEIAVAILLVVGSGLFLRSFQRVRAVDLGFDPNGLLVARMRLDATAYRGGGAHPYYTALLDRLRALPGVAAAGGTTGLPMDEQDIDFDRPFWRDGEPRPVGGGPGVQVRMATLGYFETMRIPLRAGRHFDERDDRTRPRVLIVNEMMASQTWPGENPVGRRIFIDYQEYEAAYEVVGVVGNVRFYGHKQQPKPAVYIPHAQNAYLPLNLVIRAENGTAAALAPAVRRIVLEQDAAQPVHSMRTMDELMADILGPDRFAAFLMTMFAGVALLLATIGVYGVVAFTVGQRRREMGLRLALGATRGELMRLVVGSGLRMALAGIAAGLAGALVMSRYLSSLLFETSALDPATLIGSALVLSSAVVAASYLPARRAATADPTRTLRAE